ncbi:hypothetical protein EFA69_09550 [Rufibacter immobilis]|uniref:Uncharacterized protein n=1 Tax=Rufibacter immobilis TaxID=1348778 RepID=A0A3M9MY14_9BACT|nr:hypothetical protein [Rufibacter immobilis]RNI29773.1 hypothetical protein EFA69_09550 [Rufibacter immobilis]
MQENKREILKQLLNGRLNPKTAISELQKSIGSNSITIVIEGSDGLYSIGKTKGLAEERMQAKVNNRVHVILDEECALLGDAEPAPMDETNLTDNSK